MTIAIERFSDPSRRCGTESVDLPQPIEHPIECLRSVPGAVAGWAGLPASDRGKLFGACMRTGGARLGALLAGPKLLQLIRRGEIDRIACFSAKDFGLARRLAHETGVAGSEFLERRTQYFGEFAFELLAVIPYAYWLHAQGLLEETIGVSDTRALYWFSARHEERPVARSYVPITEYPVGVRGTLRYDRKGFPSELETSRWRPPPYREVFRDDRFRWDRETLVICNKFSDEQYRWHRGPANFIDVATLLELIGKLRSRYQIIYVRPRASDIVNDHQVIRDYGDIDAVASMYPDVLTIQQLRDQYPGLGFNELQLRVFASCSRFISVLGGSSYLASYFGGTNIVLARRGWEVACNAYDRWFDRFSGARVLAVRSSGELLAIAEREFV